MPFLPQQAKQISLAVLGRTGQFGQSSITITDLA
jgi:hypothetical protein